MNRLCKRKGLKRPGCCFFTHPSAHRELEQSITGDTFEQRIPNSAKNFETLPPPTDSLFFHYTKI